MVSLPNQTLLVCFGPVADRIPSLLRGMWSSTRRHLRSAQKLQAPSLWSFRLQTAVVGVGLLVCSSTLFTMSAGHSHVVLAELQLFLRDASTVRPADNPTQTRSSRSTAFAKE